MLGDDTGGAVGARKFTHPGGSRAVKRFLAENDDFEIDRSRERCDQRDSSLARLIGRRIEEFERSIFVLIMK